MIWEAKPDEASAVAGLLVAFRDWAGTSWPPADVFLRSVETLLQQPDTIFLLGSPSGRALPEGVCQLRFRFSVWTAAEECWLEDLFVRESLRGTGLGRALLDAACRHALERGCSRIELDVNETNDTAIRLYQAAGFSPHSKGMSSTGRDILMGMTLGGASAEHPSGTAFPPRRQPQTATAGRAYAIARFCTSSRPPCIRRFSAPRPQASKDESLPSRP